VLFLLGVERGEEIAVSTDCPACGARVENIGMFINALIKFLIVAFAVFLLVKAINKLVRKQEQKKPEAPPAEEMVLLREIRDILGGRRA
jgi:large conductance mechanosensitive channel